MRRTSHVLSVLYGLLALGLFRCAMVSYQAQAWGYAAFFTAASMGAAVAILHASVLLDEYRAVLTEVDRLRHPIRIVTLQDQKVADLRGPECCETWWATAGTEHDPATCTRKDTTA